MPTRKTERLWQRLDQAPALSGVRAAWEEVLGEDLPALDLFLKPQKESATSYPCPQPGTDGCPRRVIHRDSGEIVAVCQRRPRFCDTLPLSKEAIVVLRLDIPGLGSHVAGLLRLREGAPIQIEGLPHTYQVGSFCPFAGVEYSAYLTGQSGREEHADLVYLLAASKDLLGLRVAGLALDHHDLKVRVAATYGILYYWIEIDVAGGTEQAMDAAHAFWKSYRDRLLSEP